MTENVAKKNLITLLPKTSFNGKEFLDYIFYDKDGYMIASNNYVFCAIKCNFNESKKNTSEDKEGNTLKNKPYPLWGFLFRGKTFNEIIINYDIMDDILDKCKSKMKKIPKSKHKLPTYPCEIIEFNGVYFRIEHFIKFIKLCKLLKIDTLYYGGTDDRMIGVSKYGKVAINPTLWKDKEFADENPINYLSHKEKNEVPKDIKTKTNVKKIKKNGKK